MHDEPRELFWSLMELFETDEGMDADEPEYDTAEGEKTIMKVK